MAKSASKRKRPLRKPPREDPRQSAQNTELDAFLRSIETADPESGSTSECAAFSMSRVYPSAHRFQKLEMDALLKAARLVADMRRRREMSDSDFAEYLKSPTKQLRRLLWFEHGELTWRQQQRLWDTLMEGENNGSFQLARVDAQTVKQHLDDLKNHTSKNGDTDKKGEKKRKAAAETAPQQSLLSKSLSGEALLDEAAKRAGRDAENASVPERAT